MVQAVHDAANAQIKSSVMALLGLGGKRFSKKHVQGTIEALNKMQPRYLSFLSLMVVPGTLLAKEVKRHEFEELGPMDLLKEMHDIIEGLNLKKTVFRSDHASNYLPLDGVFPKDKLKLLDILKFALSGNITLKPESYRGL
jgi:coproporphyrinogen III oxidase-like Fe-S oxidoreductase